jgi:DNA-binding transcriptional ArsR family regulator
MDTLQIIAEPRRRAILGLVWDDERTAGDIASRFDVSFGAISQHLALLRDAGLVTVRKDGNRRWYRTRRDALEAYRHVLEPMWADTLGRLADAVERDAEKGNE